MRRTRTSVSRGRRLIRVSWVGGRSAEASAERAIDTDLVQGPLEDGELLIVELCEEQLRDPAQVNRSSLGEARYARVGQGDDDTASVRIGVGSPDEAFLDQPGHTPGHARLRDERSGREV